MFFFRSAGLDLCFNLLSLLGREADFAGDFRVKGFWFPGVSLFLLADVSSID